MECRCPTSPHSRLKEEDMGLKEGIQKIEAKIDDQLAFIKWLKSNGLYNPNDSAHTMRKMHEVWQAMKEK